jgi:tripartite-type tricarboxylate transporter receptor subunit TctC
MKFKLALLFLSALVVTKNLGATETIKIYSPYSPGHSATPALFKIIDEANASQNIYKFTVEFKPGGNQIIAVKSLDANSLAIIAPAYVDNIETGKLKESDYVPVHAFGDACWAVVVNKPLSNQTEFVVGGVGFGNAAHLTALALGEKYKFNVRYIVFKSNNDALVNMTGNNGVEFVIDKYENYLALKTKNPKMNAVAASCPKRLPQAKNMPTLKELGIEAPYIFNIAIAHRDMPAARRKSLGVILDNATLKVGAEEIFKLSAMRPPIFDNIPAEESYKNSVNLVKKLQLKHKEKIEFSKQLTQ